MQTEGSAKLIKDEGIISKALPVFYNPVMKLNRDLTIALFKAWEQEHLHVALPLAGSGVRAVRMRLELPKEKIDQLCINDRDPEAVKRIEQHIKLNEVADVEVYNQDASLFLLSHPSFDYIDIDPFGFPGPFLDAAVRKIRKEGILAVTATDTAPLSGTYPKACMRKYWATPRRDDEMHEIGLRILIRRVQLIAASNEKALFPIFSYSKDHYMRIFFICKKGKEQADLMLKQMGMYNNAGPLWLGALWDETWVENIAKHTEEHKEFLSLLKEEASIPTVGFFNIHSLTKEKKTIAPRFEKLMQEMKEKGYVVARTHFDALGLKTTMPREALLSLL